MEAAKYQAGIGFVLPDDTYRITDVTPGTYIMEMPVMPSDPSDLQAYAAMDRTPQYRAEITVADKDLRHDIEVK